MWNIVLGFDIAGDEVTYPLKLFEDVIRHAVQHNIKTTVHAGEWKAERKPHVMDNVKLAVDLGVNRIGHGLALGSLLDGDELWSQMKTKDISVEVCLTGNCSHPDKCASFSEHPISKFLSAGIHIAGLNVDNLLLSGNEEIGCPDPTGEIIRALFRCKVGTVELLKIIEESYQAAFTTLPQTFIESSLMFWKENVIPHLDNKY